MKNRVLGWWTALRAFFPIELPGGVYKGKGDGVEGKRIPRDRALKLGKRRAAHQQIQELERDKADLLKACKDMLTTYTTFTRNDYVESILRMGEVVRRVDAAALQPHQRDDQRS